MVKIARCFTVDDKVYTLGKAKGLNLSEAAEFGLRSALKMCEIQKKAGKMDTRIKDALACLSQNQIDRCFSDLRKDPKKAEKWVRIIKNVSDEEMSREEIVKVFT